MRKLRVIQETVDSVNNAPDDLDDWPPDRPKPPHLDAADYNGLLELEEFYRGNLSKMIAPRSPAETAGAMDRDAAFFIKDSAVHRFYIPSRVDEIVFEDEGITRCEPLSNQTLLITKYNPEYTQYAAGTGDWSNAPNFPEYLWFVYDISSGEMIPYDIKTESPME